MEISTSCFPMWKLQFRRYSALGDKISKGKLSWLIQQNSCSVDLVQLHHIQAIFCLLPLFKTPPHSIYGSGGSMRPTAWVRGAQDKTSIVDPSRKHSRNLILVVVEMQFNSLPSAVCNQRPVQTFDACIWKRGIGLLPDLIKSLQRTRLQAPDKIRFKQTD